MACKNKRLTALILAAVTAFAAIPTSFLLASSTDTAADASADTGEESTVEEHEEIVNDDGTVEQEGALGKVALEDQITIDDYEVVAESDDYNMYFYEPRLSVILENKETGKLMYSTLMDAEDDGTSNSLWNAYMKSGIVCTALQGVKTGQQLDLINTQPKITSKQITNGIEAKVEYTNYGLGLTLQITLDGDKVNYMIPDDSITENAEETGYYFESIIPCPFMGYTYMDDQDGYMLLPDGNGALIRLTNKEGRYLSGFSGVVYGADVGFRDTDSTRLLWERFDIVNDDYQVMAPVFGMAHLDDALAYVAVIESGDTRAFINAEPNGASVNYNRCYAKFTMRRDYTQPLNNSNSGTVKAIEADRTHNDLSVSYFLLSGEDANYAGMARTYRQYLLDNGKIEKGDTSFKSRVDVLGTDREEFLIGTKAVTVTTVDDVRDMFEDLKGNGVDTLLSVYKGWQKGGVYNLPIKKYKADRHIGGTGALTDLIKDSEKKNYEVYLYNDALQINAGTNSTTFDAAKMINKRMLTIDTHQQVYDTFYLMPRKSDSKLDGFVSSYTKKGVNNLAIAGITNKLFSYSSRGKYYSRQDSADVYEKSIADISEKTNLILEQPSAFLWKYTDAILDMPLDSSDYMYLDEEVPFFSMVLKGIVPMYSEYVNFEANKTEFFLNMVESGVYPSFYLTAENSSQLIYTNSSDLYSTEFSTYKDTVVAYDKELREIASKVGDSVITNHESLESGVHKVTYENGVVIYVNYTNNEVTVDGVSIGAMSYKVGDAR